MTKNHSGGIYIPAGRKPWPHEMRVANVLAKHGYYVEFIAETNVTRTADILLNGTKFEIKSPLSFNANSFEHTLKRGTRQSPNLIIDTSRIRKVRINKIKSFLINQIKRQKQIKKLLLISKQGEIIDIKSLI